MDVHTCAVLKGSFDKTSNVEKDVFIISSRAWDKENILSSHEESNLRRSNSALAPMLYHWATETDTEVYYEVHVTRVLYTARISNVDSVTIFVEKNFENFQSIF